MPTQCYNALSGKVRKYLMQPSQWILAVYKLGCGTPRGWLFSSWSYWNEPKMFITPDIFSHAYCFDLSSGIVGHLMNSWKTILMWLREYWGNRTRSKARRNVIIRFKSGPKRKITQGSHIFLCTVNRGVKPDKFAEDQIGFIHETVASVLMEKHTHKTIPPVPC